MPSIPRLYRTEEEAVTRIDRILQLAAGEEDEVVAAIFWLRRACSLH
jgi:hypothetical protein